MNKKTPNLFKQSVTADNNWHSQDIEQVLNKLNTSSDGLSIEEARRRLSEFGPNRLPEIKPRGALQRFLYQFHNVLIYVLLVACAITTILGHFLDASVIFGVVIINAIIGFVQEGKAENALKAIRQMLSPQAMVLREGKRTTVPATDLVHGDIVLLQSGDKVPADLRLYYVKNLQIQEAVLTGESVAVEKSTESVKSDSALGDRYCMAYSGTLVTSGQGMGIVVETGVGTEIGRISSLVAAVEKLTTPLLRQMSQFGHWLTLAIIVISIATFAFGVLVRDYMAANMFLAAVGLAVAAIPEGLPAIMTITLAIGVQRMAARNAIIRRLPAVETLGSVCVICTDKTGTLTHNEMTVRSITTSNDNFQLTGSGYDPHGGILLDKKDILAEQYPQLLELSRAIILCNDANLDANWQIHGDPMEAALLIAGIKAGLDIDTEIKKYPRTDIIPFESEHRFMATLHHNHMGQAFIYLKGAPERVLDICSLQRTANGDQPLDRVWWENQIDKHATQGQRMLAVAFKSAPTHQTELDFNDVENNLTILGLLGLIDPPRVEAIAAVRQCQAASIRVKMITGDHAATARAIARQLELTNVNDVLTGHDLEQMQVEQLRQRVLDVDVYARVSPDHKLRLVEQLQEHKLVTAMTGDGVNDAPALKRADVGIAMGNKGSEAAKEASEIVLADDNFVSISHAVEEGRTVYDNIKKAIMFILPTNGGQALTIIAAIIFGFQQLPLTAVQILWVNMITAVTLALALAFEPPETMVMQRQPRNPQQPILTMLFLWRIAFVSIILVTGTFSLFLWQIQQGTSIEYARTVAVNTLVMFEIFYLFNSRYLTAPVLNRAGLLGNKYVLLAISILIIFQLGFTYLEPLQALFGTAALNLSDWGYIILVASSVLILVELEKAVIRRIIINN